MKLLVTKNATSVSVHVFIRDSSATTGVGLTGLVFNTSGLTAYYALSAGSSTSITLATLAAANSAYSSGGFKEVDATNMPGIYRFDIPNAVFSGGTLAGVIMLRGATNMEPCVIELEITALDLQTQLSSQTVGSVSSGVNVTQLSGQTVTASAGVTFPTSIASPTNITGGTITTVTNLTNAATAGDLTSAMAITVKNQIANALNTDTYSEPAQGTPPATAALSVKLNFLYKAWRNQSTQTSSTYSLYNSGGSTVDHKATVSDDGTTFTRGEAGTGP